MWKLSLDESSNTASTEPFGQVSLNSSVFLLAGSAAAGPAASTESVTAAARTIMRRRIGTSFNRRGREILGRRAGEIRWPGGVSRTWQTPRARRSVAGGRVRPGRAKGGGTTVYPASFEYF